MGAGQVLPIRRGAGIDQKLLLDFARHLAGGDWCHVFPEGGCWQLTELGGRRADKDTEIVPPAGKLKWGVGKLIAHAPIRPKVVPFAHCGMENLLPHDENRKTYFKKDFFTGERLRVHIKFGKEIHFDDIIQEYEDKHGTLWKYQTVTEESKGGNRQKWKSSDAEKELYHKITLRIEDHLDKLTKEVISKRDSSRV